MVGKRSLGMAGGVLALLLAAGCGSPPDAAAAEGAFLSASGASSVKAMCDGAGSWPCFYDGVEGKSDYLVVKLGTDGGADGSALARAAGVAWFNLIHCDFPDLGTIVVRVNGVDHNVFRGDTKADLIRC